MTGFDTITLILLLAVVATGIGYSLQKRKSTQEDDQTTVPPYTEEELDNIKLAEELYNKDLRPIVVKKAKPKVANELNVVEAEFIPKESKPEFPIDKPKKKRKYYPKKPKTNT
jgi:hypothetical protein